MRKSLIKYAIANLKGFGYSDVSESNIFTVELYRESFEAMLKTLLSTDDGTRKEAIQALLTEIKSYETQQP